MGLTGLALGMGSVVLTASMVQAEDDADIRAFLRTEAARYAAQQPQPRMAYASTPPSAYAPARQGWRIPLFQTGPNGLIAHPPVDLNPFRRKEKPATAARTGGGKAPTAAQLHRTAFATGRSARTICVRLCDGYHAPIGYLRASADLKAHEALCQAMNPGLPVKVFTVAAGAETIDDARASDGKTYRALPTAYAYQAAGDKACRPAIVQAGERRVSLLRDITLRPGDSVVLDGKVSTFTGGSSWPYSRRDFRDFRSASELTKSQRREIDARVGISRMEAQARKLRGAMKIREASLHDDTVMSDAVLRGSLDTSDRGPVRLIPLAAMR
ncbi:MULTISPECIES: DUF2865 domain-containing protein [unclassified Bosea (in: a-proteobacteria)]|uniref:DUF2865 domain-containing protein n=1 Tax=unclassified Bosea (in: a-proteobacteria) TaxID=2653178 RepID=UPI000970A3C1|nr:MULTISPECIES: DUF2865 domain-containing protein [unclassified Bosea (in: a-proteobacteria)]